MLLSLSTLVQATIPNRICALFMGGLFSLFTCLQFSSIYFGGSLIDYKYYIHSGNEDFGQLLQYFKIELFFGVIAFVMLLVFTHWVSSYLRLKKPVHLFRNIGLIALTLIPLIFKSGAIWEIYMINKLVNSEVSTFEGSLFALGINPRDFSTIDNVKVRKGKNIILLSLESLEAGYLDDKLSYLTPNLSAFANENVRFNVNSTPGCTWTSGSLYSLYTGVPAFFKDKGNLIFQSSVDTKLINVPGMLHKAGYSVTHLLGKPEFGGLGDILNTFDIDVKSEKTFDRKYQDAKFGIHDLDLFAELKFEIDEKSKDNQPFAIFLSSTSTHGPNGVYDDRVLDYVEEQETELETMVLATDYMFGDLINFLKKKGIYNNTIIYVLPDHLLMGKNIGVMKKVENRSLYMLSNANKNDFSLSNRDMLTQIDLSKLILEGAQFKHNFTFLSDYIKGDKISFLEENRDLILSLNESSLKRQNHKDPNRFIAHAGGQIDGYNYTNSLEALNNSYENGFRLFELDIIQTSDKKYVAAHDWPTWERQTGIQANNPPTLELFLQSEIFGKYTPMDLEMINTWFRSHKDAYLITDKINSPLNFSAQFIDKQRLMMELFSMKALRQGMKSGIHTVIASQSLVKDFNIKEIQDIGVKDVAVSYKYFKKKPGLFTKLKNKGISTSLFGLHGDEVSVFSNEKSKVKMFYTDNWEF